MNRAPDEDRLPALPVVYTYPRILLVMTQPGAVVNFWKDGVLLESAVADEDGRAQFTTDVRFGERAWITTEGMIHD